MSGAFHNFLKVATVLLNVLEGVPISFVYRKAIDRGEHRYVILEARKCLDKNLTSYTFLAQHKRG